MYELYVKFEKFERIKLYLNKWNGMEDKSDGKVDDEMGVATGSLDKVGDR